MLVEVVAVAALVIAALRADWQKLPAVVKVALLYAAAYVVFLTITLTLFDASTYFSERFLVPIVPSLVLTVAWLVRAQPILAAVLICVFGVATLQRARTVSLYGIDYSSSVWSPARFNRELLPMGDLYSNWPGAVAYFTGRSPQNLPAERDPKTLEVNASFGEEMTQLASAVRNGRASLVIFNSAFLEIPRNGVPITESPAFRNTCRPLNTIVTVCTRG